MSTLRYALGTGMFVYGMIVILQLLQNDLVRIQAIAVLGLLCLAGMVTWGTDEHRMKRYEMILLWASVLAFSVYTVLRIGGIA
jgi:hypothetical protein